MFQEIGSRDISDSIILKKDKNKSHELSIDLPGGFPKTAIIGASGFLGSAFKEAYSKIHPDCIGTARKRKGIHIFPLNLLALNIIPLRLAETQHKEALILAGISKISKCETDKMLTRKVNIEGTLELIRQLVSEGVKPIFASSDYVFDGDTGNYSDDSSLNPITEYGFQKAEVEAHIGEITNGNYLVVRLSKVFSLKKRDGTLLDEMAATLWFGEKIVSAYDQIFCPILISDLISAVASLQACGTIGIVNVCSSEVWSRYELALQMANVMKVDSSKVSRISLDELESGPTRPKNTSMKIERLLHETQCTFTPMSKCIDSVAKNWRK